MTDTNNLTLDDVIRDAVAHRLFTVQCSLPGRIKSWDETKQLAQVEVCLNPTLQSDGGEETVVLGVISNVPIEFPSGGGYFISFPLAAGDPVKLTFADFSLDQWLEKGGVVNVVDTRNHHLSDASAFPGMRAKPDALSGVSKSKLVIGKSGDPSMQITIDGTNIKLSDNAIDFVALAQKVLTELQHIQTAFSGHTHTTALGACTAGGATGAVVSSAAPTYSPSSVAATKVKAE